MRYNLFIFLICGLITLNCNESYAQIKPHLIKCGTSKYLPQKELIKHNKILGDTLDTLYFPNNALSPSGRFLIHYFTQGYNAVSNVDKNHNGIPDYIDSVAYYFDRAYRIEVEEIGYNSPIDEKDGVVNQPYDIFVLELGKGDLTTGAVPYYGLTRPVGNELYPTRKYETFRTFIQVDNNYSSNDSTYYINNNEKVAFRTYSDTSIRALKITTAHEFHHSIQYIYGINGIYGSIMEMMSTFMEWRLYPEVKDWEQFVKSAFKNYWDYPFGNGDPNVGYYQALFFQFIYLTYSKDTLRTYDNDKFSVTLGDSVFKRMWELVGLDSMKGLMAYQALDSSLVERGTGLVEKYLNYTPWIYYTGYRTIPGKYFPEAADFPILTPYDSTILNDYNTSFAEEDTLGTYDFEMRPFRYYLQPSSLFSTYDTLDVMLMNIDLKNTILSHGYYVPYTLLLADSAQSSGLTRICSSQYYYGHEFPLGLLVDSLYCDAGFPTVADDNYAFPSPYNPNKDDAIYFPIPADVPVNRNSTIDLDIYDIRTINIFSAKLPAEAVYSVDANSGRRAIKLLKIPDNMNSGVYLFTTKYNSETLLGKFVVKR